MPLSRRSFLVTSSLSTLALTLPATFATPARAAAASRTLILLELKGGNDGLNMLPPKNDALYQRLRPTLAIDDKARLGFGGGITLHPALAPLLPAVERGELCAALQVGYDKPNRSHFRSIEIWDQASAAHEVKDDGWVTRALRVRGQKSANALDGLIVRGDDGPLLSAHTLHVHNDAAIGKAADKSPRTTTATTAAAAHVARVREALVDESRALLSRLRPHSLDDAVWRTATAQGLTPRLQQPLQLAAQVALANRAGGAVVPVVKLTLPGFDTHVRQAKPHEKLLAEMAAGLAALRAQLVARDAWRDTVVVVTSEFGRRVRENENGGTDHGAACPVLVFSGAVKGGVLGGSWDLADLDAGGDLKPRIAHTALFASVARGAFSLTAAQAQTALGDDGALPLWA
jgi:uncharacterized protein (DUF1501 family)